MTDTLWLILGAGLLLWVLYDIIRGQTWLHRRIARTKEPMFFWALMLAWTGLAFWTLGFGYSG
ncbi:hypothetical protein [Ferrimonas marina]|uniref:Uncharacterized protein n=1 Tax=Ferrimonas marina TaxID=299255 RepID=A0A1M5Z581_9GAMM|nr:hypothetical protein [Ferrimonas marina]SHI19360.1 hypothetical protein SAMN02745129_4664 [Ferrimonas marina]